MKSHAMLGLTASKTIRLALLLGMSAFALVGCGGSETRDPTQSDPVAANGGQADSEDVSTSGVEQAATAAQPGGSWWKTCAFPGSYYTDKKSGASMFMTVCARKNPSQLVVNRIRAYSCRPWCLWNDDGVLKCSRC
jgi:hypothetical protein